MSDEVFYGGRPFTTCVHPVQAGIVGSMFPIFARTTYGFVYTFTVIWAVGMILAAVYARWQIKSWRIDPFLWMGVCGLIGGRIGFVWLNQAYFAEHPSETWRFALGGYAYWGVVMGMVIGAAVIRMLASKRIQWPILTLLIPFMHAVGWLACLFDGCGYGMETTLAWYTFDLPDNFGVYAVRVPTQLWGVILFGLLTAAVVAWQRRFRRPVSLAWIIFFTALIQTGITFFRGDPWPQWYNLRLDLWLGFLFMTAAGLAGIFGRIGIKNRVK